MKPKRKFWLELIGLGVVLAFTVQGCALEAKVMPLAVDGVIDLSGWDFEQDGIVELKGEWRFVWGEFVEPMPSEAFRAKYPAVIQGPANWPTQPHSLKAGEYLPGQGYATYVLEVMMPAERSDVELTLRSEHQGNSAKYVLVDGESSLIVGSASQGTPGISKDNSVAVWVGTQTRLYNTSSRTIQLYLQVSNYRHARGGMWRPPVLGFHKYITEKKASLQTLNFTIFGICFIIALYHLVLFGQRREDKSTLFFGLFCAAVAIRQVCTGNLLQQVGIGYLLGQFESLLLLEYITSPLIVMSGGFFIQCVVPGYWFNRFMLIFGFGVGAVLIGLACIAKSVVYTHYLFLYQLHILCPALVTLAYLVVRAAQGHLLARWVLLALSVLVVGGVHDIAVARTILQQHYITPYTFVLFILIQSGVLSGRAALAHRRAEHLSLNLQEEVDAQTKDLKLKTVEAEAARLTAVTANEALKLVNARELSHANNLLVQSEKLSQLGTMVAGIGHEIANPIGLIAMSAENFNHTTDKLEKTVMPVFTGSDEAEKVGAKIQAIIDDLREINGATTIGSKRLKELSMALRTQSRMDLEATPGVDLNEVVKEAMVITGGRTKAHGVDSALSELPEVSCYRSKIGQVLTNLLANAADALTEKVQATRTAVGEAFKGQILVVSKAWEREGMPGVLVSISDNGDGVPEAIREKIFDQFFTTKPAGVGTGLGLAMCVDIVKDHGGLLSVSDDEDLGGARFELWLPVNLSESASLEIS